MLKRASFVLVKLPGPSALLMLVKLVPQLSHNHLQKAGAPPAICDTRARRARRSRAEADVLFVLQEVSLHLSSTPFPLFRKGFMFRKGEKKQKQKEQNEIATTQALVE